MTMWTEVIIKKTFEEVSATMVRMWCDCTSVLYTRRKIRIVVMS